MHYSERDKCRDSHYFMSKAWGTLRQCSSHYWLTFLEFLLFIHYTLLTHISRVFCFLSTHYWLTFLEFLLFIYGTYSTWGFLLNFSFFLPPPPDSFRTRDREMRGTAQMQYEDFIGLAMGAHKWCRCRRSLWPSHFFFPSSSSSFDWRYSCYYRGHFLREKYLVLIANTFEESVLRKKNLVVYVLVPFLFYRQKKNVE